MYDGEMTWADAVNDCSNVALTALNTLIRSHEKYMQWQTFRAGRTNAQIAAVWSVPETQVAQMDAAYSGAEELYRCANNEVVSQGDRLYALRIFS